MQKLWIVFSLFSSLSSFNLTAQSIHFQLTPPKDSSFTYRMSKTIETSIELDEKFENGIENSVIDYNYQFIKKNNNDVLDFHIKIKDIVIEEADGDIAFEYDSKATGDIVLNERSKAYQDVIDHLFNLSISSTGNIEHFSGIQTLIQRTQNTTKVEKPVHKEVWEAMQDEFGDEPMAENFNIMTNFFPTDVVQVGDSWSAIDSTFSSFGVISNNIYTLKKVIDDLAIIQIQSKINPNPNAEGMKKDGVYIRFDMTGTQEGNIVVNFKTGWLQRLNLRQKLHGTMLLETEMFPQGLIFNAELSGVYACNLLKY